MAILIAGLEKVEIFCEIYCFCKESSAILEKFIVPRYDPYNNPWEPSRRNGADGHATCVIGMFYCKDKWGDSVPSGYPKRNSSDVIGNVFVTKDTVLACGWSDPKRPWSKMLAGKKRPREQFACSLIPFDLLTIPKQNGEMLKRLINDVWFVPIERVRER